MTLPFLLQLTITVSLVGYLSFQNGQETVNSIVNKLLFEIANRVEKQLEIYTSSATSINQFNRQIVMDDNLDFKSDREQKLLNQFYSQIQLLPEIHHIYWANKDGEFSGIRKNHERKAIFFIVSDHSTDRYLKFYRIDSYKNLITDKKKNEAVRIRKHFYRKKYNPKARPWYKQALEKKQQNWSKIYTALDNKRAVTNTYPVYDDSGKLKGVLGVDLYSHYFSDSLKNVKVATNGEVFIIDSSGTLIASSTKDENSLKDYNVPEESFKIINSNKELIKKIGLFLFERFDNNLKQINKTQQLSFDFEDKKHFLLVTPFKDNYGLDWLIVVAVPESDFMQQIHANTRNTIILCIIALIVAIYIGILTARWITNPILQINTAAKSLAKGYWGQKIRIDRFDELGQLARSFNTMASQLQQSFTALEETNRTLEQKVTERTKELSQTVELLKATQEKLVFENELLKDTSEQEYQYQIGGTLPIDSPTYVVRKADKLLYKALKKGQFCYIFNARQMGKSSLRAKIMHQLSEEGYLCAALDLTEILSNDTTENQFYNSIIFNLAKKLGLLPEFNYRSWKKNLDYLSSLEKLREFIEEVLLEKIQQKVVIFIDEIDAVLDLKFPIDRFFAFLRSLYNKRADRLEYRNFTVVLIGRTAPSYLIQNTESTPFNIGCGIALEGFKIEEVSRSFTNGLRDKCDDPYTTIKEVLAWTNGQPFLTQKICNLIRESSLRVEQGQEQKSLAKLIETEIFCDWENKDQPEHLKTIRNNLTKNKYHSLRLLEKYREMLLTGSIADDPTRECLELFLSGIARKEDGKLKLKNRIYQTVFDRAWVDREIQKLSN